MMLLKHIIGMNGIFTDISINCKTYVVGYPCAIKCHVPDFKHEIAIFGPQNTRVGRCSSDRPCSVVHNGFELKRNLKMKSIILKISELNKNHVGNWYCVYGGGGTSNEVQLRKVKDLPTERSTSRYLEVNEGESITLHCDFDFCCDCFVIKWYKDGIELQGKDPSYQVEFQSLTITKITQEDKGVYMCSVTESGFTIRNGSYIVIYSVRKKSLAHSSQYLSAFEGQPLTLICDLVTNELVTVASWKLDGIDLDNKMKYKITYNGDNLIINDLNKNDKGTYVCYGTTDRGTQLHGPNINLYSIASIPKRDPQSLTENPSPTRNTYADTSQGYAQINPFWNISVWLLVLMFKFGFWLIYLWIFGPVEYCNITKSLFSDASLLILLQRWIIVLGPALIIISTPTTITVFEDVSVFSSPTVLFIVTVIFCRAVKRDKLIDPRIAEEQRRLCN